MEHHERALLERAALRLDAKQKDPDTQDAHRPGLAAAAYLLREMLRGDDRDTPPAPNGFGHHRVYLSVEAEFHGDYYEPGELVGVCRDWIDMAFEDREDVGQVTVDGIVRPLT